LFSRVKVEKGVPVTTL